MEQVCFHIIYPIDDVGEAADGISLGLITKELLPHVKAVLGVDISEGVVDVYNRRYTEQGLSSDIAHAITKEITGAEGELDGRKFDVITVCFTVSYSPFLMNSTIVPVRKRISPPR